jgi:hypothetical protein
VTKDRDDIPIPPDEGPPRKRYSVSGRGIQRNPVARPLGEFDTLDEVRAFQRKRPDLRLYVHDRKQRKDVKL